MGFSCTRYYNNYGYCKTTKYRNMKRHRRARKYWHRRYYYNRYGNCYRY